MRVSKVLLLALIIAMSGYAYGQAGDGFKNSVVGSHHDLHATFAGGTAVCEYCHVPHKFNSLTNEPPLLWNVQVKSGPYTTYSSSSMNGTTRDPSTASSTNNAAYMSLLCLSCHDGTVTQASFYQVTSAMGGAGSITTPNIGTGGLANDHPVDFTYSVALATADTGLQSPTEGALVVVPHVGKTIQLPLFKDQPGDTSGRLECATCHNPHNDTNMPFLRMANASSALCLNCHGN